MAFMIFEANTDGTNVRRRLATERPPPEMANMVYVISVIDVAVQANRYGDASV